MATGAFTNSVVPTSFTVTVGTSPTRLKTSSALAVKFTVIAPSSKLVTVGDSSVSGTRGIPITGGTSKDFNECKLRTMDSREYDLAHFWAVATASNTTVTVITYGPYKDR